MRKKCNRQMAFVNLLDQFSVLLTKSHKSEINAQKEKAILELSKIWFQLYSEFLTSKQVIKKVQNMRLSLRGKLINNGNARPILKEWEQKFQEILKRTSKK